MSSKKLLEQCQKLEKLWGHVLTGNCTEYSSITYSPLSQHYWLCGWWCWHFWLWCCRHSAAARGQLVHQGDGPPWEAADRPHMDVRHQGEIVLILCNIPASIWDSAPRDHTDPLSVSVCGSCWDHLGSATHPAPSQLAKHSAICKQMHITDWTFILVLFPISDPPENVQFFAYHMNSF